MINYDNYYAIITFALISNLWLYCLLSNINYQFYCNDLLLSAILPVCSKQQQKQEDGCTIF